MVELSKKDIQSEFLACGKSPAYFIDNFAKIEHPIRGVIPFKTWPFQKQALEDFSDFTNNIILKSRQLGISTLIAGYCAWLMTFHRGKKVLIIATKIDTATNILRMVKFIIKNLPKWFSLFVDIRLDNEKSFTLSNGSKIKAIASSEDAGRSEAASLVVIDEAAHIPGLDVIWTSLGPTLSSGGRCIALSSPLGVGNWFHQEWLKAEAGENDFHPIKLDWAVHPERDEAWEKKERNKFGKKFAQEYECFSGDTRIATLKGYKRIEEIRVGDKVLTHKGRFKKVLYVNEKIVNETYNFRTFLNRKKCRVTANHPILEENENWTPFEDIQNENKHFVCSQPKNVEFLGKNEKIDLLEIVEPNFFSIKLFDENTIFVNDRKHKVLHKRFIDVDYNLGRLIGLFLAEGNISANTTQFSFCYPKEEVLWVKDVINIVREKFGIETPKIYHNASSGSLVFNSVILCRFIEKMKTGLKAPTKRMSDFAYDVANKEFLMGVLDGIFEGDGCLKKQYSKTLNVTSEELIYDVKFICLLLGIGFVSTRKSKEAGPSFIQGRPVLCNEQHTLKLLRTSNKEVRKVSSLMSETLIQNKVHNNSYYNDNENYYLTKLLEKEKVIDEIIVFNLQVEEDESYVTEHFVVHNCDFATSGETFLQAEIIQKLALAIINPPYKLETSKDLWVWELYSPLYNYMLVCDWARGDGFDNSTIHVIKLETLSQVAEYKSKLTIDAFAELIDTVGRDYGNGMVVVENNGLGYEINNKLIAKKYPNIYYQEKGTHAYVPPYEAPNRANTIAGFTITPKSRPTIIAKLEECIRNEILTIRSERTIAELRTFIWNNGKAEAMKGKNDDLIIPLAIACEIRDVAINQTLISAQNKRAVINNISFRRASINTAIPGMSNYSSKTNILPGRNQVREETRQNYKKFGWLF